MNDVQATELIRIAERIQAGLIQLGLCYECKKAGLTVGVSFRSLELVDQGDGGRADFGLLEVDTLSLPRKVTAGKLTRPDVLHHLAAVIGRPVYHTNSLGLTYIVDLRPPQARGGTNSRLSDLVDFTQAARPNDGYLALGMTTQGPLWVHPEHLQNLLVVGAQGYGKSALLRLLVYQAIKAGWRLMLADPDQSTFNPLLWAGADCLIGGNVATSPGEVSQLFALALAEVERRADLFRRAPSYPDTLTEYNATAVDPLPRMGLIVDEANTYLSDRSLAEGAAELARRARKWGLHVALAGHNWRATEIPRALSAMLQTRVAYKVNDDTSGKVVLERAGAEILPATPGRAIVRLGGEYKLMQTYFLDKSILVDLVKKLPKSDNPAAWEDIGSGDPGQDDKVERVLAAYEKHGTKSGASVEAFGSAGGNDYYRTVKILKEHGII